MPEHAEARSARKTPDGERHHRGGLTITARAEEHPAHREKAGILRIFGNSAGRQQTLTSHLSCAEEHLAIGARRRCAENSRIFASSRELPTHQVTWTDEKQSRPAEHLRATVDDVGDEPRDRTAAKSEKWPFGLTARFGSRGFCLAFRLRFAGRNGRFPSLTGPLGCAARPGRLHAPAASQAAPHTAPVEGGEGRTFVEAPDPGACAWGRFRQGSLQETERSARNQTKRPPKGERSGVFGLGLQVAFPVSSTRTGGAPGSADEGLDRPQELLVGGVRVDGRRRHRLVPSEALRESKVAAGAVEVRARRVTKRMDVEDALEAGALLPDREGAAKLPSREAAVQPAHEERRLRRDRLALGLAHGDQLLELGAHGVGEQHFLGRGLLARTLEDAEREAPSRAAVVVEDVADVQRQDLVLAKPGAEGNAEDDVIAPAVLALAGDGEELALLLLGEGACGASDGVGEVGHDVVCLGVSPYTLLLQGKASDQFAAVVSP